MSIQVVGTRGRIPDRTTEWYYLYEECLTTLKRFDIEPLLLGTEEGEFKGLLSKAKLLKKAIESGLVTADWIIFTDTFDVLYAEDPRDVIEKAKKIAKEKKVKIIWNAEKNCFPIPELAPLHPATKSPFKYLNSGWGVGETAIFLAALKEMNPDDLPDDHVKPEGGWHHSCDQTAWQKQMIYGSIPIGLDHDCQLCQAFCNCEPDEFDFSGEKIRNKVTKSFPPVLHLNGGAKSSPIRGPVLKKLGFK